jgi:hypothetical protein
VQAGPIPIGRREIPELRRRGGRTGICGRTTARVQRGPRVRSLPRAERDCCASAQSVGVAALQPRAVRYADQRGRSAARVNVLTIGGALSPVRACYGSMHTPYPSGPEAV